MSSEVKEAFNQLRLQVDASTEALLLDFKAEMVDQELFENFRDYDKVLAGSSSLRRKGVTVSTDLPISRLEISQ